MILLVYFVAGIIIAIGVHIAGLDSSLHFKGTFSLNRIFDPTLLIVIISALIPIGIALKYRKSLSGVPAHKASSRDKPTQTDFLIVTISVLLGFLVGNYIFMGM